ncbi:MAG TPA: NAD(P)/FAD-dependent oxidoreductase [Steroidobacteraceae bacterium]|nr:NAD(P)/FAD-dependent oxidoreductase [Steroidobacteraceae bacterium]
MTDPKRVIVVGGGHNGLVCAAYLARAGRSVLVLEAAAQVGGAAVTREFAPGFRVSAVAHLLHLLDSKVARHLDLARHGLRLAHRDLKTVAMSDAGPAIVLDGPRVIAGDVSDADRRALLEYHRRLAKFSHLLAKQHGRIPARVASGSWREAFAAIKLALDIRRLGRRDMREFLRLATMNIFDVLEDNFESPLLKGALAIDGVLGAQLGPRSGNTVFTSLYRASGHSYCLPQGGMGALTDAMADAARAAGVEIRTSAPVGAITLEGDRIRGVRLASGEEIAADLVVSNADPKTTLLRLLGARHLETEFARRVQNLRGRGNAAKLHLALSALPRFQGVAAEHLGERLLIAPTLDYIEAAFNPAKYREHSTEPALEITIPSVYDRSLAPAGQHVLSAIVQYAPCNLGAGWDKAKHTFQECVLDVLERAAPGLRGLVVGMELLTPLDIERQFRISGGHWHHGELALDQFMMLRPVPGAGQYAMPVNGLYLCGAGCHPGGGVMGTAGRNAATAILRGPRR